VELGAVHIQGKSAEEIVKIHVTDTSGVTFRFTLSRQAAGMYRGCWMLDGVVNLGPEL
jgi:hypothetical protein